MNLPISVLQRGFFNLASCCDYDFLLILLNLQLLLYIHLHSLELRFFCIPPFLFTYQLDLALHPCNIWGFPFGGKANRIAEEAIRIREGVAHHWFGCRYLPWAPC